MPSGTGSQQAVSLCTSVVFNQIVFKVATKADNF